jgi:hypothetical protein
MSAAELRELLEADLALLSDDEEDDSLEDFTQHEIKEENKFDSFHEFTITELSGSNEDWKHLMESAALAEARFQGLEKSIINDQDDQALSDCKQVLYFPTVDYSAESLYDSELILDPSQNVEDIEIDMTLIIELKDLMNSMIEAVERCAPIVPVPHLERKAVVVDLSLLPQLHIDDDNGISYRDSVMNTSRMNNDTISVEEEESEMQSSLLRQRELEDTEAKLRNDENAANNEALERRKNMVERKRVMDEELRLLKKERALVSSM